jgi:hypothetical protein
MTLCYSKDADTQVLASLGGELKLSEVPWAVGELRRQWWGSMNTRPHAVSAKDARLPGCASCELRAVSSGLVVRCSHVA